MNECQKSGCRNLKTICDACGRTVSTATLPKAEEWISVKERLPEEDVEVISWPNWESNPSVSSAFYIPQWSEKWRCAEYMTRTVTHWQPLPEPPND
jgi:hypothetical protein